MKLLTKAVLKSLPALYTNEETPDPMVPVKFFQPWGSWTWYVIEGEAVNGVGMTISDMRANLERVGVEGQKMLFVPADVRFFGLVDGFEAELGYFSLAELESVRGPFGLKIERDLHWKPTPLSEVQAAIAKRRAG